MASSPKRLCVASVVLGLAASLLVPAAALGARREAEQWHADDARNPV